LNEGPTAQEIWRNLPLEGMAEIESESIYFQIDVWDMDIIDEQGLEQVKSGTIAYWPDNTSIAIYLGGQPDAEVVPIGKLDEDVRAFLDVMPGTPMRIEAAGAPEEE
jgi:hypothetical protein